MPSSAGWSGLTLEALGTERGREVRMENLERHRAIVLEVAGEEHRGHAAAAELALDRVATAQPCRELRLQVGNGGLVRVP